jgi:hypothetical protein
VVPGVLVEVDVIARTGKAHKKMRSVTAHS